MLVASPAVLKFQDFVLRYKYISKKYFEQWLNQSVISKTLLNIFGYKLCRQLKNEQPVTLFCDTSFYWDVDDDATAGRPISGRQGWLAVTSLYLFRTGHKSAVRRWNTVRREAAGAITRDCYTATGPLSRGLYSYLSH